MYPNTYETRLSSTAHRTLQEEKNPILRHVFIHIVHIYNISQLVYTLIFVLKMYITYN